MEESFHYLTQKGSDSALNLPKPELFSKFARNVTKTRARLKLFDDTDGYTDGLVEALAVAHAKSREWLNVPHRSLLRSWIRHLQPDLGIYFLHEDPVATTHSALPAVGITLDELRAFGPGDLDGLGRRLYAFSHEVGAYLAQLSNLFERFGKPIELVHKTLALERVRFSHNDFLGAKVYNTVTEAMRPREERFAGAALMAQAQINCAAHALPLLLADRANLLFRIQFLTAYHARNTLSAIIPWLTSELPTFTEGETAILTSRKLRNLCAHYGLRGAAVAAIGTHDPFSVMIESQSNASREDVATLVRRWLTAASSSLRARVSKSTLRKVRALFGDHN
ncbi:hypothetical protein [Sorangium sp. So ce426]|uniref:hypothetical protein n=1 Tax=Sorangium sp. So ce426 TaxID=3133312 RepID=UPI003F5B79CF